jgi:hypothetical protein
MAARDAHPTIEELLEAVFSVRSVPRLHNEEQLRLQESLETAVRRVGDWCEMVTSNWSNELVVRESPGSKDVNTDAQEATALKAVTRRQPVNIQRTEKT